MTNRLILGITGFVLIWMGSGCSDNNACESNNGRRDAGLVGKTYGLGESYDGFSSSETISGTELELTVTNGMSSGEDIVSANRATSQTETQTRRGIQAAGSSSQDSSLSCTDGSTWICSPGGCCGPSVTSTPSACCPAGCCTNTTYCDYWTGGCGYSCESGEIDCGNGNCCPRGSTCSSSNTCILPPSCDDSEIDCGDGYCCPADTSCGDGNCEIAAECPSGYFDCEDGYCCPDGSTCAGGGDCEQLEECPVGYEDCGDDYCCPPGATCTGDGECEQPGCGEDEVDCGEYCCNAGDVCEGSGQCRKPGCAEHEKDCGDGWCCPSDMLCTSNGCEPPEIEETGGFEDDGPGGGYVKPVSSGSCDESDIRDALSSIGGFSSGNSCIDHCIDRALSCAGAAGCVLTDSCMNQEISCVQNCFMR